MAFTLDKDIPFLKRHKTEAGCMDTSNERAKEANNEHKITTRAKSEGILDLNLDRENTSGKYKSLNDVPEGTNTDNREKQNDKEMLANSSPTRDSKHTSWPEQLPNISKSKRTNTKAGASGCWNSTPVTRSGQRGPSHVILNPLEQHLDTAWDQRPESPNEYVENSEEEQELLSTSREASQNELFRPSTNNASHADMTLNTSFTQQTDKETDKPLFFEVGGEDHISKELEALRWHGVADGEYSSTIELNSTSSEQPGPPFERPYSKDRPSSEGQSCSTPMHKTNNNRPQPMALHPYAFDLLDKKEEPASASTRCQERKHTLAELCSKTNLAKVPKKVGLSKKAKIEKLHNYIRR